MNGKGRETRDRREKIAGLRRLGHSAKTISQKLGISEMSVITHLHAIGEYATPHGKEKKFTDPTERRIVCDYLLGASPKALSARHRCAAYHIYTVLWRYGLPEREVLEKVRKDQAEWMIKQGMKVRQIASCFGLSVATVLRWLQEKGITPASQFRGKTEDVQREIAARRKAGESLVALGREYDLSPNTIRNYSVRINGEA